MDGIKNLLASIVLALVVGLGLGAWGGSHYTQTKLEAVHTAAVATIRREISDANVTELNKSLEVERAQTASISRLEKEKLNVIAERDEALGNLSKRRTGTQSALSSGRVLVDPKGGGGTTDCRKDDSGGASKTPGADAANTGGELSGQASQFLLDFASSAEVTRLDLIASKKFGDATYKENLELRKQIQELLKGKQ